MHPIIQEWATRYGNIAQRYAEAAESSGEGSSQKRGFVEARDRFARIREGWENVEQNTAAMGATVQAQMRQLRVRPGKATTRNHKTGSLDRRRIAEVFAGNNRVFTRIMRTPGEDPPPVAVSLDVSGSMEAVLPHAIAIAGAILGGAEKSGVPNALYTFSTYCNQAKGFGDRWPRATMPECLTAVWNNVANGGTNIAAGLSTFLDALANDAPAGTVGVFVTDDTTPLAESRLAEVAEFLRVTGLRLVVVRIVYHNDPDALDDSVYRKAGIPVVTCTEPDGRVLASVVKHYAGRA